MSHTFLWHDYEAFGADPRRDRPAQFAAVRTDAELNEVGEPVMLHCQPTPDYVPDPDACLLTGITPQQCLACGVPEPEFARRIEAELGTPGTIGVGYNTIRYDDEMTRHLLWRNLRDPYAREWQNGCGRWDILDMVRTVYALRPELLDWPHHAHGEHGGKVSFRLEDLTRANAIEHRGAHDALVDVRATLALARLIRQRAPKLFGFCLRLRHKDAVAAELGLPGSLSTRQPFLHISGMFPVERGCLAVMAPLAMHPTNSNELIAWDLAHDPAELAGMPVADARQRLFSRTSELPEGVQRLPIKSVHLNKSPVVVRQLKTLSPELAKRWQIDLDTVWRHAEHACALPELSAWVARLYQRDKASGDAAPDVDTDLYGGFIGPADRRRLAQILQAGPEQLARLADGFDDARLPELVGRYRARHFPGTLSDAELQAWREHCAHRLVHGGRGWRSLSQYSERIDALAEQAHETGDARAEQLLAELCDYADAIAPDL